MDIDRHDGSPPTVGDWDTPMHCTECGEVLDPAWAFCGSCGAASPTPLTRPTEPEGSTAVAPALPALPDAVRLPASPYVASPPVRHRRPWLKVTTIGLIVVLAMAGAGYLGYLQQQTGQQLAATRTKLATTRHQLATTAASWKQTKSTLADAQAGLASAQSELTSLRQRLAGARRQLSGVRGSLQNAQSQLSLQAGQIETLKTCLKGVTTSLVYASENDYQSALAALDAVDVSCQQAEQML